MNENISRLMDGECDADDAERVCGEMRQPGALATWACYHVIGDTLRGSGAPLPGFAARMAAALAAEPTVLAPARRKPREALPWAWAAAATVAAVAVVGWTAMSLTESPGTAVAKAREATTVTAAQVRPVTLPQDYVLVHQEYSPATQMQGVGPYLRAVAAPVAEPRR